jgi:LysM repeat protein
MRAKSLVVSLLAIGLTVSSPAFAGGTLSKMREWFSSKKRSTTVTGVVETIEGRKITFKTDDGQTLELTGRKAEKLMDQQGATVRIFGNVRKPDGKLPTGGLEVRNFRVVEAAKAPEPVAPVVETPAYEPEPMPEPIPEPVQEPEPVYEPEPIAEPIAEPVAEPAHAQSYQVVKGDTLAKISKKVYGTTKKWKAIAEANRITNPKSLKVGMNLTIPE